MSVLALKRNSSTVRYCFEADVEPAVLPRALELLAKRGLMPARVFAQADADMLSVEIEVEAGHLLGDTGRMIGRDLDDAVAHANALGALAGGGEKDFGLRRVRVFVEEMMLDLPRIVVAKLVGELDLVALDGGTIVFVEVRSTETTDPTRPALSVDAVKQRRLTDLALHFLQQHRLLDRPARFDILAVSWPANQRQPAVVHYPDAFEAVGRFQMYS